MAVLTPFSVKNIGEAVNGELVMFAEEHGGDLAIKFGEDAYDYAFLAVLKTTETDSPHGTRVRKDAKCISYGVGWLIEIDPLRHYSYSQDIAEASGSIHLSENGPLMRLGPNLRDGFHGTWLNLTTNEPASHPYDAYATLNWRLWLDAKDRENPKASPFLVFPPTAAGKA
ncbi:hypothetical protein K7A42_21370 [Agrobacterium sp. InxBP2]|uniref:hypothetical protein n=1 Tax=Agrobacterium sp. InxBP2 TaxID=2870329 RepID=UPI00249DEFB8|nr:hypothetical protein [Agrobacterium sp. InxBP2]MCW8283452.1 hypothetical protein [Agrobacterium sp. InxBP2]